MIYQCKECGWQGDAAQDVWRVVQNVAGAYEYVPQCPDCGAQLEMTPVRVKGVAA